MPLSVVRAAIMHAISEFAAGILHMESSADTDPEMGLVIITGRVNHSNGGQRTAQRGDEVHLRLGLVVEGQPNPGRVVIAKATIEQCVECQLRSVLKADGSQSAHKNLFLQVAHAKQSKKIDLKAVSPFSSTAIPLPETADTGTAAPVPVPGVVAGPTENCPAHAAPLEEPPPVAVAVAAVRMAPSAPTGKCPAHMHALSETTEADPEPCVTAVLTPVGKCPAHAHG